MGLQTPLFVALDSGVDDAEKEPLVGVMPDISELASVHPKSSIPPANPMRAKGVNGGFGWALAN